MRLLALARGSRVKKVVRGGIARARSLAPARRHVVVYGWPQDEGNAVELVRGLAGRGVDVRWLIDEEQTGPVLARLLASSPTVRLRKRLSLRGFLDYLTATTVFYTHGLFLSPASPPGKTIVNLWHGDGPKRNYMPAGEPPPRCDFVVSCSEVFGASKAEFFGLTPDRLLVTGNPRNDRLFGEVDEGGLAAVDLISTGYVVYMPTYRAARAIGTTVAWRDVAETEDFRLAALEALLEAARGRGLQVVVKAHPLDETDFGTSGAVVLTDGELSDVGLTSYQLLAGSFCLVTDYSSIWTDYLSTGRHVAFAVPDWDDYATSRGLDVAVTRENLPGPVVTTVAEFTRFLADAADDDPGLLAQREHGIKTYGLVTAPGNVERLLGALDRRGVQLPEVGRR